MDRDGERMSAEAVRHACRSLGGAVAALEAQAGQIAAVAERYRATLAGGGTLFLAGNGGSAAHAQHIAAEYTVRFRGNRQALRAVALAADAASLTAAGNDLGFESVFARQLEALGRAGDVLVVISTSGRSANLVAAAKTARRLGLTVVGLLGGDGGLLVGLVDVAIIVPATDTARIQELQLFVDHTIVDLVERGLTR